MRDADLSTTQSEVFRLVIAAAVVAFIAVAALAPYRDVLGLGAVLAGMVASFWLWTRTPSAGAIVLLAFVLRAGVALVGYYLYAIPEATMDAVGFERHAISVAEDGWRSALGGFTADSYFFASSVGLLYALVGHSPLLPLIINAIFGTGTVFNVYVLSKYLRSERFALVSAAVAALFPALLLYSGILLREAGWVFFATTALVFFFRWDARPTRFDQLAAALACGMITGLFHAYGAILLAVLMVGACVRLFSATRKRSQGRVLSWLALFALLALAGSALAAGVGMGNIRGSDLGLQWINSAQYHATRGRTSFPEWLIASSWLDVIWTTPIRIVWLLFAPFPWAIREMKDVIGAMDAMFYLAMMASLLTLRPASRNRHLAWLMLASLAALVLAMSLTVGNYGTAFRHRAKFAAILIVLVPWEELSRPWVNRLQRVLESARFQRMVRSPRPPNSNDTIQGSHQARSEDGALGRGHRISVARTRTETSVLP